MAAANSDEDGKGEKSGYQERSLIEFPYSDLDNAVDVGKGVHTAGGTSCEAEQLAAALQMEAKGGAFRARLIGAQTFGLIEYERGGKVTLTDLGRQVVDSQTERAGRVASFLTVPLYAKVYDNFKGSQLPGPQGLEQAIVNMGVGKKVADRARQVLVRSAKQAGFFDAAPDRLVKPAIKTAPSDVGNPPPPDNAGGNAAPKGLHPLIQGLLMTLPPTETPWSATERYNWLTMANSIFKNIYKAKDAETGDVTVQLTKGEGN